MVQNLFIIHHFYNKTQKRTNFAIRLNLAGLRVKSRVSQITFNIV